jgi:hypothetical protein
MIMDLMSMSILVGFFVWIYVVAASRPNEGKMSDSGPVRNRFAVAMRARAHVDRGGRVEVI